MPIDVVHTPPRECGDRGRTVKYEDFRARALQHVDLPIDRLLGDIEGDVGDYPSEWRSPPKIVQVRETERYVAPEMTGAEDLYQYGSFESAPEYGTVWYPRDVPAGNGGRS